MMPALVRPRKEGGYEIISGHRRKAACALADVYEMPVIVRDLDDDASIIAMTDSNMQRENLLPSEKAFAYKMRLEAIKRQAGRPSKGNSRHVVGNIESADIIGKDSGESGRPDDVDRPDEQHPGMRRGSSVGGGGLRMKGERRYLRLDCGERRLIIETLNRMRNRLIAAGRYTEAVDELLIKVIG